MKIKLSQIADVRLGYQHRERVSHAEHGSHRLLQGNDIVRNESIPGEHHYAAGWKVWAKELKRVTPKGDASRYRVQPGDLLFVSRGTTNIAVPLVQGNVEPFPQDWHDIIAAYTFYILRPDTRAILPEYLAWYINTPPAQAFLAKHARGTLVKLLPKGVFEELTIPVPPLEIQQQVMALENSRAHEEHLLRQLISSRHRLVQQACLEAVGDSPIQSSNEGALL